MSMILHFIHINVPIVFSTNDFIKKTNCCEDKIALRKGT